MREKFFDVAADRFQRFYEGGAVSELGESIDFKHEKATLGMDNKIGAGIMP